MRILIVDDSRTSLAILTSALNELGHEVIPAMSGPQAIDIYRRTHPDFVILDVVMPEMDGFECARQLRDINTDDWIPIIFLSATIDDTHIARGINAGGDDYLPKPFSRITLAAKIKAMQRIADMRNKLFDLAKKLSALSTTDMLTGLYNRLHYSRTIVEKMIESDCYNQKMALLYIDLDNFKPINDSFGHHTGDLLLKAVAQRFQATLRVNDIIARIGGDEFTIIISRLEDTNLVHQIANKIIQSIARPFTIEGHTLNISASIGIVIYPLAGATAESLLRNADDALYRVKNSGRNGYLFSDDDKFTTK